MFNDTVPRIAMTQGASKERLRPFKPQRFGRYDLLMPLSTGGMGEIFLARLEGAQGFEKLCVIKKILPHLAEDKEFVDRFVDEARILVKLSHGNIAQVLDMGLHEGAPYIALEFVDGKDLRRVVARARERALQLPLSFVLYVATRMLDALAYAHRKRGDDGKDLNLVHRDVSPQNILISYEGEVKIIDFGLAKSALSSARTHPSIVLGKFLYMSPEQARHQKADRRSDLYAVGLCLYELIAGKGPFDGVPPGELMVAVANPVIAPLSTVEPLCPPTLSDVVMKALSPDPTTRFQTAEELRGRLLGLLLEIDASAGPETASRFMAEAFASEHQTERKQLAELSEQARALQEPAEPQDEASRRSVTRDAADAMPALTLEDVPAAPARAPEPKDPSAAATIQALSFQPTRKGQAPTAASMAATATVPSLLAPTELMESNVVLDQALLEAAEAHRTRPENRAPSKASLPAVKAKPVRNTNLKAPKAAVAVTRPEVRRANTKLDTPAEHTPLQVQAAVPRRSNLGWMALPLLAVFIVVAYIAWDRYSEGLRRQQLDEPTPPVKIGPPKKARATETPVAPPVEALPVSDPATPLDVEAPRAVVKTSAGERALGGLKADLKQLTDEAAARKFVLPLRALEDRVAAHGAEAAFLAEVNQLHAQVREALAQQQ